MIVSRAASNVSQRCEPSAKLRKACIHSLKAARPARTSALALGVVYDEFRFELRKYISHSSSSISWSKAACFSRNSWLQTDTPMLTALLLSWLPKNEISFFCKGGLYAALVLSAA